MKMKKVLTVCLAVMIAVSSFAGCGKKQEVAEKQESKDTYTYWSPIQGQLMTVYRSLAEVSMYKELEKKTGKKIEFLHPSATDEAEQFNLMIASKKLPDMIEYNWRVYPGGLTKAISDGIIVPLNDYEKEIPNYLKRLKEDEVFEKAAKTDNGDYFGFVSLNIGNYFNFCGFMLRQDWLEDLNLSVPETISDWENVLTEFKTKKGAKAPLTDMKRLFEPTNSNNALSGGFGIAKGLYTDNGKVKYGPMEPEHKEYVETMRRWYKNGLIDKDFQTNTSNITEAKITSGESGAVFGSVGSSMGVYLEKMKNDPNYKLVAAPYPVRNKGEGSYFKYSKMTGAVDTPYLCITTQCSDIKGAAEWADNLYSDEGYMLMNFGIEGEDYNMVDGYPKYTDKILKSPSGLSISEALMRVCRAPYTSPGINQAPEYLEQFYQYDCQKEALEIWERYPDDYKKGFLPPITYSSDESDEISSIESEIQTYVEENVVKFITGDKDMSEYDGFIEDMKSLGVERYIEITQSAYDRYLKR